MKNILFKLNIWWQIKRGYLDKDLTPLKCPYCKYKKFKKVESFTDDICGFYQEVEFILNCEKCNKEVGHWAYGSWIL